MPGQCGDHRAAIRSGRRAVVRGQVVAPAAPGDERRGTLSRRSGPTSLRGDQRATATPGDRSRWRIRDTTRGRRGPNQVRQPWHRVRWLRPRHNRRDVSPETLNAARPASSPSRGHGGVEVDRSLAAPPVGRPGAPRSRRPAARDCTRSGFIGGNLRRASGSARHGRQMRAVRVAAAETRRERPRSAALRGSKPHESTSSAKHGTLSFQLHR